jgi:hypothetical protein
MRSPALAPFLIAACVVPFACATYENDGGQLGGPRMPDEAGTGGADASAAGTGQTTGGIAPTTAGSSSQAGSSSNAGSFAAAGADNEGGAETGAGGTGGGSAGKGGTGGGNGGSSGSSSGNGGMGGKAGAGGAAGSAGKGGTGGTGGGGSMACSSNPLSARATWIATASHSSLGNGMESDVLYNPASHMLDGNLSERWSSGKQQSGDEWIQIDFGKVVTLSDITLQHGTDTGDFPVAYTVRVSNNSGDFNASVRASGAGAEGAELAIMLAAPATGRYLTIRQTGASTFPWWSIAELQVSCSD